MAVAPSNKKSGKSYLKGFNKDELVDRSITQAESIMLLEQDLQKLKNENAKLEKENDSLKRKLSRITTKDFVKKKILDFRAKNYSPVIIRDKLKLMNIDKSITEIKDIINSELSPSLELYFSERKKEFADSIKINTTYYSQSSIEEIQRLIDSAYEDLEVCDEEDIKQKSSLRDSISNYLSKRDNLMKNISETKNDKDNEDKEAEESLAKWEQESENALVNLYYYMDNKNENIQ